jgi:hypothetical protein
MICKGTTAVVWSPYIFCEITRKECEFTVAPCRIFSLHISLFCWKHETKDKTLYCICRSIYSPHELCYSLNLNLSYSAVETRCIKQWMSRVPYKWFNFICKLYCVALLGNLFHYEPTGDPGWNTIFNSIITPRQTHKIWQSFNRKILYGARNWYSKETVMTSPYHKRKCSCSFYCSGVKGYANVTQLLNKVLLLHITTCDSCMRSPGQTGSRFLYLVPKSSQKAGVSPWLTSVLWVCLNFIKNYFIVCTIKRLICITFNAIWGRIQKFPHWPPGARTTNGTALCHLVQLYRYFVSQFSEFCHHNRLCCCCMTSNAIRSYSTCALERQGKMGNYKMYRPKKFWIMIHVEKGKLEDHAPMDSLKQILF